MFTKDASRDQFKLVEWLKNFYPKTNTKSVFGWTATVEYCYKAESSHKAVLDISFYFKIKLQNVS